MYPHRELTRLAAHKAALQHDIALRRVQCAVDVARVAQPLEWVDRMLAFWRRLSPLTQFAVVPLGLLVKRAVFPRLKILNSLARWSPLIFGIVRGINSKTESNAAPSDFSPRP